MVRSRPRRRARDSIIRTRESPRDVPARRSGCPKQHDGVCGVLSATTGVVRIKRALRTNAIAEFGGAQANSDGTRGNLADRQSRESRPNTGGKRGVAANVRECSRAPSKHCGCLRCLSRIFPASDQLRRLQPTESPRLLSSLPGLLQP